MANGKGSALAIIALILGAGGLGFGIYTMFFTPEDEETHESYKLVAVWEELDASGESFNIAFNDNQINQSDYVSMSNGNTTLSLNHEGWFKLTLSTTWFSLDSGSYYEMVVLKNGILYHVPVYLYYPTEVHIPLNIEFLMYSDGDDAFRIHCYSSPGESSYFAVNQDFNQAFLEYVLEVN